MDAERNSESEHAPVSGDGIIETGRRYGMLGRQPIVDVDRRRGGGQQRAGKPRWRWLARLPNTWPPPLKIQADSRPGQRARYAQSVRGHAAKLEPARSCSPAPAYRRHIPPRTEARRSASPKRRAFQRTRLAQIAERGDIGVHQPCSCSKLVTAGMPRHCHPGGLWLAILSHDLTTRRPIGAFSKLKPNGAGEPTLKALERRSRSQRHSASTALAPELQRVRVAARGAPVVAGGRRRFRARLRGREPFVRGRLAGGVGPDRRRTSAG